MAAAERNNEEATVKRDRILGSLTEQSDGEHRHAGLMEPRASTASSGAAVLNGSATQLPDDENDETDFEQELQAAGLVEPPDGGYGWVIVAASFLANCIVDGVIFTAGQGFASQWEKHYGATTGATSLAVSLLTGCYLLAGPIVSALANYFGCRLVAMAGTLLTVAGFLCSLVAPNLYVLYFTFGIMGGTGFGMVFLPSIVIVSYYFKTKRALATGIAVCGSGIGMFLFAPIIAYLQANYNWQQTLLLITGITLQLFICAALYRPLEPTESQITKVAEIALEHEHQRVLSTRSLNKQTSAEADETDANNAGTNVVTQFLGARATSKVSKIEEEVFSPHVQEGVRIERFEDPEPHRDRKTKDRRNSTPFKSALELSARSQATLHPYSSREAPMSTADLLHAASKDTVNVLNRPLSRLDIFYTGSMSSLALRQPHVRSGSQPPDLLALSMMSIATFEEAHEATWKVALLCAVWLMHIVDQVQSKNTNSTIFTTFQDTILTGLHTMIDVSLLKSPVFLILALNGCSLGSLGMSSSCSFFTMAAFFVPFIFLSRAAQAVGHDEESSAFLISILGIVNIFARVFCGWLSDRPQLDALTIHNVAVGIGGLATMAVPLLTSYWMFIVYCLLFGFGTACFASLRSVICVELLGLERLSNSFGLCMLFMGIAALCGAPLAGFLADATGSYDVSFYVMGFILFLSALIAVPLRRIALWEQQLGMCGLNEPEEDTDNGVDAQEMTELTSTCVAESSEDANALVRTKLALISAEE